MGNVNNVDTQEEVKSYPNILQSWGMFGLIIAAMVTCACAGICLFGPWIGQELAPLLYYVISMALALLFIYPRRKRIIGAASLSIALPDWIILPIVFLITISLDIAIISPLTDLIPIPDFMKTLLADSFGGKGIFTFLLLVVAAPVFEEILFRGIMLDGLLKKYSPMKAILFSSFLFGLIHLNPWQMIAAMVIGIFIGWVYYKTHNLLYAILIHATSNFSAYLTTLFVGEDDYFTPTVKLVGGIGNFMIIFFVSIIVIMGGIFIIGKRMEKLAVKP